MTLRLAALTYVDNGKGDFHAGWNCGHGMAYPRDAIARWLETVVIEYMDQLETNRRQLEGLIS